MVKLTLIARVTNGLPLAEGLDGGRDPQDEFYKQQAKSIFENLSNGQHEPSRMSIETDPHIFQYPFAVRLTDIVYAFHLSRDGITGYIFFPCFWVLLPASYPVYFCSLITWKGKLMKEAVMRFQSYQNRAEVLVRNYVLSDPFIPYTSVLGGIFAFKLVYDLAQLISISYVKSYIALPRVLRIEWNNRVVSTVHAIFIGTLSLYFVFWSDLFSDHGRHNDYITLRSSYLSTVSLGVSVGYFVADLGMIFWLYPALGGIEYIVHHTLSAVAVAYVMYTQEAQVYTFMVLISEVTTPEINMRWYLDILGLKRSKAYLINGVLIFVAWLVARILLFVYLFYHVYLHFDEVLLMHTIGFLLVFAVPSALATMNLVWFRKILRGLKKTLAKRDSDRPKCILSLNK